MVMPLVIGLIALFVALIAELVHARRVSRVRHLAFGPSGRPRMWASTAPLARVVGVGLAAWGLTVLLQHEPREVQQRPTREASKHLLICLDVSPSMLIEDSGPGSTKTTRAEWAGEVMQTILDRLDMETTRVTLFAIYTDALPVMEETFDKDVISNTLDGLRMYPAFTPGSTDLQGGIEKALERARPWPKNSATLVVISDGDSSVRPANLVMPVSIADTIVIGVGDPHRSTMIAGHSSRQDPGSLKRLAARMDGVFHDANTKHLPSKVLDGLTMIQPRLAESLGLRELALIASGLGGMLLAGVGPALVLAGSPRRHRVGGPRSNKVSLIGSTS